ncbi:hypothetical protein [Deminuibacter soli]|uniref:Circularly permuted type 2 ATP-grasp protein n=1 Tax=Deminuibacter soli TaxID=2291815 RepID=A0A3E1NJ46_9BACT|nr:hypothetical protein [Deminuibacter soli]RFM27956.1 hypothetical protein DXN05_10440 [Deminuibacter soli]
MIPRFRQLFNAHFSEEKYHDYLHALHYPYPGAIEFRVAETPVFINQSFRNKMLSACESIIDFIVSPDFKTITERAIPDNLRVPGENAHPHFIAFDFGICTNEKGETEPQLVEMQGFPSLFAFQALMSRMAADSFDLPRNLSAYLNGYNEITYLQLLRDIITNGFNHENVILLELHPHEQKTRIDFYLTRQYLGIEPVCITELVKEDRQLYYYKDGRKIHIKRIYNRLIFDELLQQPAAVQEHAQILFSELDVEWVTHPNWFYRISKFTLPFIKHPYVPETFFLDTLSSLPANLNDYVLKPLFSFAGNGVVIDVTAADIRAVQDPQNWILQRKVQYAEIIKTPNEPSKAEIRLFYFWKDGAARPVATQNLARLSKGKMIGTRYNQNKDWVGGSLAFFEN